MADIQFYLDVAMCYFFVLAVAIVILFLVLIMVISHCKRIEQKLNFLMRDNQELYDRDKKKYRLYK